MHTIKFQFVEQNESTPTDFQKSVGVNLCFLRFNFCYLKGEMISPLRISPFRCVLFSLFIHIFMVEWYRFVIISDF